MLIRAELHAHSWFSADASDQPERLIAAAKRAGLHALAITDHDSCQAHEHLLRSGLINSSHKTPDGLLIIPGVEVSTAEGHLLCLGCTLPFLKGRPAREVIALVNQRGGLAVPAHPFDGWRAGIPEPVLDTLPIPAIEVFNAAVTSRSYNERAAAYANRRGLIGLAGSDAHHAGAIGVATVELELDQLTLPALLHALRTGTPSLRRTERYLTALQGLQKHFANWFRFLKHRRPPRITHPAPTPTTPAQTPSPAQSQAPSKNHSQQPDQAPPKPQPPPGCLLPHSPPGDNFRHTMTLSDKQRKTVAAWVREGMSPGEVQSKIKQEFGIALTYLELRLLMDELKVIPKDQEPPPEEKKAPKQDDLFPDDDDPEPLAPKRARGKVTVTLDQIARPNALVSGKVTFSDGQKAEWYVDPLGRPAMLPDKPGYRPSQEDLMSFQMELQRVLRDAAI